jgi:hypothetical protein
MKFKSKKGQQFNMLKDILINYALMNWDEPDKNIGNLQKYIENTKKMDIGLDILNSFVKETKEQMYNPLELSRSKAVLFTRDKKIRIIKFGSDYCPNCHNYKNNERECQHCGFFELILYYN